jgi:hypothetical protein
VNVKIVSGRSGGRRWAILLSRQQGSYLIISGQSLVVAVTKTVTAPDHISPGLWLMH